MKGSNTGGMSTATSATSAAPSLHAWLWTREAGKPAPPALLFLLAVFAAFLLVQAYIAISVARRERERLTQAKKQE